MSELIGFRTIQKFRYFLAGVFPFLATKGRSSTAVARWLQRYPKVVELGQRVTTSALGTNVKRVAGTFVLGSYGSDALDWARVPEDSRPLLWTELRAYGGDSTRFLLQRVALETSQHLANYEATGLEQWEQYYPGALALDCRYYLTRDDDNTSALGTTALAPLPNGEALLLTVVYAAADPARRWDLARALQALPQ
jgi:hypothetical protein